MNFDKLMRSNSQTTIVIVLLGVIFFSILVFGLTYFVIVRKKRKQIRKFNAIKQSIDFKNDLLANPHIFSKSWSGSPEREQGACSSSQGRTSESPFLSTENSPDSLTSGKSPPSNIPLGKLQFSIGYNESVGELLVSILHARDLPQGELKSGGIDSYIKLELLPEKIHRVKTRVVRNTRNPFFGEAFTFDKISSEIIEKVSLHFLVATFDKNSREKVIGDMVCCLSDINLSGSREIVLTKEIIENKFSLTERSRGRILISLCYLPAANRITVVVLKAEGLPKTSIDNLSGNPYVKIYFSENSIRITKKKTHVKRRTSNPVFNEAFALELPHNVKLENVNLHFRVVYWDREKPSKVIGSVFIGFQANESAKRHWKSVLEQPRKQFAEWHELSFVE